MIGSTSRISDKFFLRYARLTLQPDQDGPLRPGHAVLPGPLVRIDAQQARDIVQQEQQVAVNFVQWRILWVALIISRVIIWRPARLPCVRCNAAIRQINYKVWIWEHGLRSLLAARWAV